MFLLLKNISLFKIYQLENIKIRQNKGKAKNYENTPIFKILTMQENEVSLLRGKSLLNKQHQGTCHWTVSFCYHMKAKEQRILGGSDHRNCLTSPFYFLIICAGRVSVPTKCTQKGRGLENEVQLNLSIYGNEDRAR